jgi:hypothetical protein
MIAVAIGYVLFLLVGFGVINAGIQVTAAGWIAASVIGLPALLVCLWPIREGPVELRHALHRKGIWRYGKRKQAKVQAERQREAEERETRFAKEREANRQRQLATRRERERERRRAMKKTAARP